MFLLSCVGAESEVTQFGALQNGFAVRYMEPQSEQRVCCLSCNFHCSSRASASLECPPHRAELSELELEPQTEVQVVAWSAQQHLG